MTVNTNGVRTCAVSGCTHAVMPGKLMCLAHWERVPRSVQFDVYRRLGDVQEGAQAEPRSSGAAGVSPGA